MQQARDFQDILGLERLPANGAQALETSQSFAAVVLSTFRPTPVFQNAVLNSLGRGDCAHGPCKRRFVDLTTGFRMRYLEWTSNSTDTIILLHSIGRNAAYFTQLGHSLKERGYSVFAVDLRGHGGTEWSPGGRYALQYLVDDVRAFILAKDLYVQPVAIVGHGMGGVVGLTLASLAPKLVGAVACIDFGLDSEALRSDAPVHDSTSSTSIMPWWSFWLGQGVRFASLAEAAAFVASPLANIGPVASGKLLRCAPHRAEDNTNSKKAADEDAAPSIAERQRQILNALVRPAEAAVQDAATLLPSAFGTWDENGLEAQMDPKFFFTFDVASLQVTIRSHFRAHLLVLHGEQSGMVSPDAAHALAALPASSASAAVVSVPGAGHHLCMDAHKEVHGALIAFLEGPAVRCFDAGSGADARRPECLGLRPLPEFATLEEARKALGPRSIPTIEAVEAELRRLRAEDGEAEEEEGPQRATHQTALARDPSDYFGFVG